MTKTVKTAKSAPISVSVRYDLFDLPTAQHKAGLAGLVLQIESMKARAIAAQSIPLVEVKDATTVEATFTVASLCGLFDDLYDARFVLTEFASRRPGATVVEEKTTLDGKTGKSKKVFVYRDVQPQGHFLRQFTDGGKEIWHKLWRNMLWAIPRGKPTTRNPFNNRAAGASSGEGEAVWKELLAMEKKKRKNEVHTCEVSGAILLGAQAVSAESIPFGDRADQALLLHFWQLTARIFVPEQVDADGNRDFVGYLLAIPEVADLPRFIRRYTRAMNELSPAASGYRPAEAVISLPEQGALEFMDSLARLAGHATSADLSDVARALAGVEVFHMVKVGNNIKTMMHGRIPAASGLLTKYESVKATSRNPMFRAACLLAVLRRDERWYAEFEAMMAERPWALFMQSERTPRHLPSFALDVNRRFRSSLDSEQTRREHAMTTGSPTPPAALETLVYRLVRTYVRAKTEQRSGITYASFKDRKKTNQKGREFVDYPAAYTEAQEKVCSDLFLGLRSRRDEDFVSFFAGTVGSVAQGPNLSDEDDYSIIARALLDEERRRDVQTLAMLAVSAASFSVRSANGDEQTDMEENAQ